MFEQKTSLKIAVHRKRSMTNFHDLISGKASAYKIKVIYKQRGLPAYKVTEVSHHPLARVPIFKEVFCSNKGTKVIVIQPEKARMKWDWAVPITLSTRTDLPALREQ